jgi:NADPH:quinone reductase-like Zn-dependent oxidoreductase
VAELGHGVDDVAVGDEVFALMPFDRDGAAADYALLPASDLAPKPQRLSHVESAALTLAGLSAWQALFDHGALRQGEHVCVLGTKGGVGQLAVQLAGDALVGPDEPCDLLFDTAGGETLAAAIGSAPRIVSVAEEADGVTYFIVEPNRAQLIELGRRADAGQLSVAIDSTFALEDAAAAFARVAEHNKNGKVVLVTAA